VAAFGRAAAWLEGLVWSDSRVRGAAHAAACTGAVMAAGMLAERLTARRPVARAAATALGTWTVLGARSLRREAGALRGCLERADLAGARGRLPSLCGRDPSGLDAGELARAGVESVAENTADAAVGPLLWGAVAGLPGLLGYRAVNTLDAMIGHRSPRYLRFGWAAARVDDLVNLPAARLAGALTALGAPVVGGRAAGVLRVVRHDGRAHPSPNAGVCEAAFAGALGVRLGGRNTYGVRVEDRPVLGDGRPVQAADLARAARLSGVVVAGAAVVSAGLSARLSAGPAGVPAGPAAPVWAVAGRARR
jgi:adenosylcobinamide-phosphate synthase